MFSLNCKGRLLRIDEPIIMGIINTTPDSFYLESRVNNLDEILFRAEQMISDGATILDLGGQSTRPQSQLLEADEELQRVMPAVEAIHKRFPGQLISIDTFYAKVARHAVDAGASIVNDVSAGTIDAELIPAVAEMKLPYILMHMKGNPQTMQKDPSYKNVITEVFDFLSFRIQSLVQSGINDIIIDPGFGFGKNSNQNFLLLKQLSFFRQLGRPVMVGLSRKSTIWRTLNIKPGEALNGSTVMHTISLMNGASILRVHDVKQAAEAIQLFNAYTKAKEQD